MSNESTDLIATTALEHGLTLATPSPSPLSGTVPNGHRNANEVTDGGDRTRVQSSQLGHDTRVFNVHLYPSIGVPTSCFERACALRNLR
jgi:hypothetical protein